MNERTLQLAIMAQIGSRVVAAAPNYTPGRWWECDLWTVTKTGRFVEYECKCSIADLRADKAKASETHTYVADGRLLRGSENKHALLAARSERGPSRFYYVVPAGLQEKAINYIPEWAGLYIARKDDQPQWGCRLIKSAPELHKGKSDRKEIKLCQRRMWFRYWQLLQAMHNNRHPALAPGTPPEAIREACAEAEALTQKEQP